MKTTLEIDDALYREAKAVAALTGRKMKDLVGEGLRWVVEHPRSLEPNVQVLGCLKRELDGRNIKEWMDELRGAPEQPKNRKAPLQK